MIVTYVMIFVFFILISIFIFYILSNYVFPRKIEEIAKMIEAGQTKLAISKLNEILAKDDRNHYAHFLLAEAHIKENNIPYAILEYRQVLKISKFDEKVIEIDVRNKLANIFMEKNNIEDAKKEFLILTKLDPNNFDNYYKLGVINYESGILDKAVPFFKKCLSINPAHDDSYYYLGQIFYKSANYNDAKQMLLDAIKIDKNNFKAHYFLGLVLRQIGDHEWAIKEFEIAQRKDELKVKCYLAKGTCYSEKESYHKAILEFEKGLKYTKKGSDTELNIRYFLADAQEHIRDIQNAIVNWEQISSVNRNFRDVQQKLNSYAEFRQDDRIKDFLIAGLSQFEHDCRKLAESMGFTVTDIDIKSDTDIEILATETEGKWRNTRTNNRIIRIMRTTDTITDKILRQLNESMKQKNATRIIVISTGDFSQAATDFANTRPIELFGKSELVRLLKSI